MKENQDLQSAPATEAIKPWYRYAWPWVAIAIPAAAVIMGLTTLYLALANPDYLVVDEERYDEIKSELRAQEPQATRRSRLGKSSEASGTKGVERPFYAVERSRLPPQAGAGKRDSLIPPSTGSAEPEASRDQEDGEN